MQTWKQPRDYGGFSPDGDYVLLTRHRDSDALSRSNWERVYADLDCQPFDSSSRFRAMPDNFGARPAVYDWRASHWAVGWVEYLMIRADAPQAIRDKAQAIADQLENYPVYDEDHYSELEWNEACEYWEHCSVADRIDLLRDTGVSVFAARRAEFPRDDNGTLFDRVRS